jgi:DNA-nicking Smr family endonuclease
MAVEGRDDEGEVEVERGDPEAAVELELGDVLDLHSFPPREVAALVRDYLDLAVERGWPQVRIVHGKGRGVQRETVRRILAADPRVEAYGDPPGEAGGWGATWVRLRRASP